MAAVFLIDYDVDPGLDISNANAKDFYVDVWKQGVGPAIVDARDAERDSLIESGVTTVYDWRIKLDIPARKFSIAREFTSLPPTQTYAEWYDTQTPATMTGLTRISCTSTDNTTLDENDFVTVTP